MTTHYVKKRGGIRKPGLPRLSSPAFGRLPSSKKSVSRAYGGVLNHDDVKDR